MEKKVIFWSKTGQKRKIIKKGPYNVIYSHKITKNTKKIKKIFLGPKNIFGAKKGHFLVKNGSKKENYQKRSI